MFKNTKKISSILIIIMFGLLSSSCAQMSDANKTRTEAGVTGAVVGGVAGQLLGGSRESAAIGAIIGGAIGTAIGENTVQKKKKYASAEDELNDIIANATESLKITQNLNFDIKNEISRIRQRTLLAKNSKAQRNNLKNELEKDKIITSTLLTNTEKAIAATKSQIEEQQKTIDSYRQQLAVNKSPISNNLIVVSNSKKKELEKENDRLAVALSNLRQIDSRRRY